MQGAAGAPGAPGAASSSSSAAAGAPSGAQQQAGQRQKQQIIIGRRPRRKRKPPSILGKLKKEYTAARKVTFKKIVHTKNERVKKFATQLKDSDEKKGIVRKRLSDYKKKLREAHVSYKQKFPPATKISEIATLKSLLAKLRKASF